MIKAVIFDNDGVIVDSHGVINRIFSKFISSELKIKVTEVEFGHESGARFEERLKNIATKKGLKLSDEEIYNVGQKGRFEYFSNGISYVALYNGVEELLKELRNKNIKIGLGTNGGRKSTLRLLDNLNVRKYFSSIVTYDDVAHGKPSPDIFLKNAKEMNIKPEDCAVVEDSFEGILAASSAGMKIIAVATTKKQEELKADLVVNSISELSYEKIKGLK